MISDLGKMLIFLGLVIVLIGLILFLSGKFPSTWLGRLPGDFIFRGKNSTFYFPLATSILISFILTLLFWLINRK